MLSIKEKHSLSLSEEGFNALLPGHLQKVSRIYFTPFYVARIAAQWLTEDGQKKILDIGAGVGKFCIAGAVNSDSEFHGVEYRPSLVKLANRIIAHYEIRNAFIHKGNVVETDFERFDAFYMYNPFYENLAHSDRLNSEVELARSLYVHYFNHTEQKLDKTRPGTRLVTFHGNNFEVPGSFKKLKEAENGSLKLWIKK